MYGAVVLGRCERMWRSLAERSPAQSTVEYALIGALIVVAASLAVGNLGGAVTGVFDGLTSALRRPGGP